VRARLPRPRGRRASPSRSIRPPVPVRRGDAVDATSAATIKHPNDVLVGGKKIAGILAESSEGRVVLGIGLNVNQTADELPAETQTPVTSLRLETGIPVDRARLLAAILLELERAYDAWITAGTGASG
jgi:BirA family biotin operon repressor/biotin-[acetyl-CoA-carboxylase] ligase